MSLDSERVLAAQGRSFHLASRLLPAQARADAALLYHFCRLVDDLADEADDAVQARANLDLLLRELDGDSPRPLVAAVLAMAERTGMDLGAARELIAGVLSDLDEVRVADDRELLRYCYRVAATVGVMMCPVLGVREAVAMPFAIDLGIGMQLTNICRDVKEDAELGRRYLPAARGADVQRVTGELLQLADQYYESGERGLHFIPLRCRMAIAVAARVYRAIGRRLLRRGGDPMQGRTVVPVWEKLWNAVVALVLLPTHRAAPHEARLHHHLSDLPGTNPCPTG